jgi:DNA-binding beta-propeller fold protein YncE
MNSNPTVQTPAQRPLLYAAMKPLFCTPAYVLLAALVLNCAASAFAATPAVSVLGANGINFSGPARVATDASGRLYIADTPAGRVVVLDAFGRLVSEKTGLANPLAIAADASGNIYLAEENSGSVSVFDANWNLLQQLGAGSNEFRLPGYIALNESGGGVTVLVSDSLANEIKAYRNGTLTGRFGSRGTGPGQFNCPTGLWLSPAGELFVVDQNNDRIQVLDRNGAYLRGFTLKPPGVTTRSGRAHGITGDNSGRVYVADTFQGYISIFNTNGTFLSILGGYGTEAGQLRSPAGVAVDMQGRLFVAALNNHRVESFGLDCFTVLTASPASQFVAAGSTVTLSASPSCGGLITYQWRKGGMDLSDVGNFTGATSATLSFADVTSADAGIYSVQITVDGTPSFSPAAVVTVLSLPVITTSPVPQSVPLGEMVNLSVAATGEELNYHWFFNGVVLDVPNRNTLEIPSATAAADGNYWAVVSNVAGSATSAIARVTVLLPPGIVLHPMSQTVPEGGSATFAVAASGSAPLTYAWLLNGNPLSGASSATLSLTNLVPPQSGTYQAVVANPTRPTSSRPIPVLSRCPRRSN